MNRRNFLFSSAALGLVPQLSFAQPVGNSPGLQPSVSGTVLVELINFHCPRCRLINDSIPRIQTLATDAGIILRVAPLAWEGQSLWPDRIFYAARDLYPPLETLIRNVLFEGIQREGMRFDELAHVLAYFQRIQLVKQAQTQYGLDLKLSQLADKAASDTPLVSEVKAGNLADMSGASEVPVFIWLNSGSITDVLSPADASDAPGLIRLVLNKFQPKY